MVRPARLSSVGWLGMAGRGNRPDSAWTSGCGVVGAESLGASEREVRLELPAHAGR